MKTYRCAGDEHTCFTCLWHDGSTEAIPPLPDCTSEQGCRCILIDENIVKTPEKSR